MENYGSPADEVNRGNQEATNATKTTAAVRVTNPQAFPLLAP